MPAFPPRILAVSLSLLMVPFAISGEPPRIVGTAQIGERFLAYLLPPGSTIPVQLIEGEKASSETWSILEVHRGAQNEPLRLLIQHGSQREWLAVSGGAAPAPRMEAPTITAPLIDVPQSPQGPLHDQALHRSRIKNKPIARAAHRSPSDLDPFPSKLAR